ncbi:MAG: gfo/Idh/MocA family oxidoreductase [Caldilineae bacterium]|nr:MAG: gfo/Idh/MocA family oxidoreductase [Caldilineae bacterium]
MSNIRLAIAGVGYIARIHAQAARKLADVELTAVVNHRQETMAAFAAEFDIPRRYETLEALLQDGDVDAVSINTPNFLHAPQSIAALRAGVHVLVEKPMAMNAREAEAMLRTAEETGSLLMVAHCWRFDKEVRWLKQQMDRRAIGRIVRTKGFGVHVNWGPKGWFTQKRLAGGGALADMGIHAIDTARFLLGDPLPLSVYARIGTHYGDFDVDDTGTLIVTWDNGTYSLIESGWWQPHADGPEACTLLYGTCGFARLFPTELTQIETPGGAATRVDPRFPRERSPHCPQAMYDTQMAYFIDCIRQHRTPVPGGREGLINMRIVDAAYESASTGRVVPIQPSP